MKCFRYEFTAMGTPCDIQLFADTVAHAQQAADLVIADVQRLEQRYSRYRNDSFLTHINQVAATGGSIRVDAETSGLLNYAAACYQQSEGLFDITSGLLRKVWRFDTQHLPTPQELDVLLAKIGWHKLVWKDPVLTFLVPGMEIDLGGIVKEYAVDRSAALCLQFGVRHGVVNLGGDIKVIGPHPDGSPWRVGIRHPRDNHAVIKTVALFDGALASSGDYERCIVVNNIRYGHVLNPKTGWPVAKLAAVSVVGDFCVVAGSASTIAMLKEGDGPGWLENLGLAHLWVDVDGNAGGTLV